MAWAMSPTQQAKYRSETVRPLFNLSLRTCDCCRIRRSVGQFSRNPAVCDRCIKQGSKPG